MGIAGVHRRRDRATHLRRCQRDHERNHQSDQPIRRLKLSSAPDLFAAGSTLGLLVQSGHWPQRRRLLSASTETRRQKNAEIVARHGVPKLWNRLGILPIHHRWATSRGLCQRQRQRGTNCLRGISHGHGTRATNGNPVHQASKAILHSRKHKISRSNPDVQQGCNRKS
jgi:hypothetical protein